MSNITFYITLSNFAEVKKFKKLWCTKKYIKNVVEWTRVHVILFIDAKARTRIGINHFYYLQFFILEGVVGDEVIPKNCPKIPDDILFKSDYTIKAITLISL